MPAADLNDPITKPGGLNRLVRILAAQPVIAVDTESNSLHAYREQVCLIQFSTREEDFLVDPLTLTDLEPLAPIFADPKIEKVFHAAEYDLLCMKRDFGFSFSNLFDTMLAARILARKEVGLGAMLEAEFGLQVDKRHQRANWGQRPLPDYLLSYARQDTHFLIGLREKLGEQLKEKGLLALAEEDFRRACLVDAHADTGRDACWRVNGSHELSPQQVAVLHELCVYRDEVARARNRPLFKVMGDKTLHAIANKCPGSLEELKELPGMTPHQMHRHGRAILQAVQRGLQAAPMHPQRNARPDDRFLSRVDALKQWRKLKGRALGVESDIVLPRDVVYELATKNPQDRQALEQVLQDVPWRVEHFGEEILKVLRKHRK